MPVIASSDSEAGGRIDRVLLSGLGGYLLSSLRLLARPSREGSDSSWPLVGCAPKAKPQQVWVPLFVPIGALDFRVALRQEQAAVVGS